MLSTSLVATEADLLQILDLQKKNLKKYISPEERQSEGFLTMQFNIDMLKALHELAPSVIIKDDGKLVAYAITLFLEGRKAYPDLEPMFKNFSNLKWNGKPLYDYRFYVMGQICIDKDYRGKGLFRRLYEAHREFFSERFHIIVTEISTSNLRSLKAHEQIGFQSIATYRDELDEWSVVVWDWKNQLQDVLRS
jgi:GNAT superfamily N-acetyltransferase